MAAIGTIRNKMGGILIVVLVIAMISFLFMDIGGPGGNAGQGVTEIAVVNGEPITTIEFNQRFEQNIQNIRNQSGNANISDSERNLVRDNTYNELVSEKLLEKIYVKAGITVSELEYADMLSGKNIHPTIQSSFPDKAQFAQFLSTLDIDNPGSEPGSKRAMWENFEKYIIQERKNTKYNALITKGLTVPSWLAKADAEAGVTTVNFDYVFFSYRDINDADVKFTDADLNNYISKNAKEFKRDESVDLKYVAFKVEPSESDIKQASDWLTEKVAEWEASENDSTFIRLYSDQPLSKSFSTLDELDFDAAEEVFNSPNGVIVGPFEERNSFVAYKLLEKKLIPDSLKARHILLSAEKITSAQEYDSLKSLGDSLLTLITENGVLLSSLTPIYSDDEANKFDGGDLGVVTQGQMVAGFNDLIFYNMKEGDVKTVETQFGIHVVEVYKTFGGNEAARIAALRKNVYPSDETQKNIYQNASFFAGNNRTRESFSSAEDVKVIEAGSVTKDKFTLPQLPGNSRELIRWAFGAKEGDVSSAFSIGDAYVIALVDKKRKEGTASLEEIRFLVEAAVIKEKKAELIKGKMTGTDLPSIAQATGKTVGTASGLTFKNVTISGVGNEPKIVGVASGLEPNKISKPIAGESGVFVVKTTSKATPDVDEYALNNAKEKLKSSFRSAATSRLNDAIKEAAEITDNRFEIF